MANEATSFSEAIAENFATVFLGQGHFDEVLHYHPAGGAIRQIRGVVTRTQRTGNTSDVLSDQDELQVLVSRDPDAATDDYDVGGIDDPKVGDAIRRDRDPDAAASWYAFSGEIPAGDTGAWTLKFFRGVATHIGRGQIQT